MPRQLRHWHDWLIYRALMLRGWAVTIAMFCITFFCIVLYSVMLTACVAAVVPSLASHGCCSCSVMLTGVVKCASGTCIGCINGQMHLFGDTKTRASAPCQSHDLLPPYHFYFVLSGLVPRACFVFIRFFVPFLSRALGGVSVRRRQHVVLPPAGAVG